MLKSIKAFFVRLQPFFKALITFFATHKVYFAMHTTSFVTFERCKGSSILAKKMLMAGKAMYKTYRQLFKPFFASMADFMRVNT
ncbi:hypothetical protein C8B47_17205 [filamentous cyanobacterium CCP4]|nr:hypothetical protein C8B47_17205 [filamentous cyanobacterium CCP4]